MKVTISFAHLARTPELYRYRALKLRRGYLRFPLADLERRRYATGSGKRLSSESSNGPIPPSSRPLSSTSSQSASQKPSQRPDAPPPDWDENPDLSISAFSELPSTNFGVNQHMIINSEFKEALRQILWQFRAPIRYAFAYGSGVFPQTAQPPSKSSSQLHPKPSSAISTVQGGEGKMIDFIFGVSHTQHWHSLNLQTHRDHYSAIGSLGSYVVSRMQDDLGAGMWFHPYVTVNGTLIKYGVVNLDTLCTDLSTWTTLYLAGRLQKPVKILRDDPRVRLANQVNLLSAVRTALLLLPESFTEKDLYATIASISYMGDIRMALPAENKAKVSNIVTHQLPNFRRLYAPLIDTLPNVSFLDTPSSRNTPSWADDPHLNAPLTQDMDPLKRGNMVRRLPKSFREKVYFAFQSRYRIPTLEFEKMLAESADEDAVSGSIKKRQGGRFEQRVASETEEVLRREVSGVIRKTIGWPSVSQSAKNIVSAGVARSWRYGAEKVGKWREGRRRDAERARKEREEGEKKAREKEKDSEETGVKEEDKVKDVKPPEKSGKAIKGDEIQSQQKSGKN